VTSYVALLRAVNVSGRNKVAMADLRRLFESLPAQAVSTYVQSGNVVFAPSGRQSESKLVATIESRIEDTFGVSVTVLLRTSEEMNKIIRANPLLGGGRAESKLHVTFLARAPESSRVERVDPESGGDDEFQLRGREVYVHTPNGYGTSKLNNAFFERKLGVPATTRNWKTVSTLAHLSRQAEEAAESERP
jgi:uncharacterized protein (DUF1697 family)